MLNELSCNDTHSDRSETGGLSCSHLILAVAAWHCVSPKNETEVGQFDVLQSILIFLAEMLQRE